jgi:hypothetical protein
VPTVAAETGVEPTRFAAYLARELADRGAAADVDASRTVG